MIDPADPRTLLGEWRFERVIDDRREGALGRVDGEMILVEEGPRIRWSERGVLHWRGSSTPVSRTLHLVPRDDGWFVTFADGRDFHPWLPGRPVRHPCGADLYSGRIDAARTDPLRDAWTVHWVVTGPNKDYTMTTEISRGPGVISSPVGT